MCPLNIVLNHVGGQSFNIISVVQITEFALFQTMYIVCVIIPTYTSIH